MIGDAAALAVDVALPAGVTLRRVTAEADVRAMSAMQDEVFGDPVSDAMADALLNRLARDDGMELWVAEADGEIVSAGRLEPVADTAFAGIWAAPPGRPGVAAASTARSPPPARARRSTPGRPCCTAIPPSSRGRSSSGPAW